MSDERNRDFGGAPSRGAPPEQGAGDRRDAGADALLELARLIGEADPFAPGGSKPASAPPAGTDGRLASVSRAAAAAAQQPAAARDPFPPPPSSLPDRSYEDRGRREPDFDPPRVPISPARPDAGDGLDFLRLPAERNNYPVVPRHAADERDYERGGQQQRAAYGRDGHSGEYHDDEGEYAEGEHGMEPDDYDDDEPVAKRRRPGVVLAVLGLAVFGSAAAWGYRTVFNGMPSGPTPVILADKSPTKMTPLADTRPESGRIGGDSVGEQMERRDEEPVDLSAYRRMPGLDTAGQLPQDTAGGFPANPNFMPATPGAVAPPADSKRVHTVTISPDSGTSSRNQPRGGAVPAPVQSQLPSAPPVQPPTRQAAPPQASAPPPPQRQAALAPAAADNAAASPAVESGGYVVQVSAVRSEVDAQTAFRQLQAKYPLLSGRQPLIRRKDQGEKGIFFAAQVGPFGAKSEADQLCEQLKAAGGSCYVLRN